VCEKGMLREQGLDYFLPQIKFRLVFWRKGCVWVVISNALQKSLNHIFRDKSLEIILPTYEKERKITFWKY
jgi:hypothetical protein